MVLVAGCSTSLSTQSILATIPPDNWGGLGKLAKGREDKPGILARETFCQPVNFSRATDVNPGKSSKVY